MNSENSLYNSQYAWDTLFYSIGYLTALCSTLQNRFLSRRYIGYIKKKGKKNTQNIAVKQWNKVLLSTLFTRDVYDEFESPEYLYSKRSVLSNPPLRPQWTVRILSITVLKGPYAWDTLFYSIGYSTAWYSATYGVQFVEQYCTSQILLIKAMKSAKHGIQKSRPFVLTSYWLLRES